MWYITLETKSGVMMTLIAVSGVLPMVLISPFAGVWADRYNKKLIINISDAVIAMVTLILAIIFSQGIEFIGLLFICLVMRSMGQGMQMPAVNAMIPEIVPAEHLTRVNGISGSIQSAAMFASPVAGGALLAFAPIYILMFIDVVTAAIGISIVFFLVKVPRRLRKNEIQPGARQYFLEIGEGFKYVSSKLFLKKFLVLGAVFNFIAAPAAVMAPLQVARNYGEEIWIVLGSLDFGPEHRLASLEVAFFIGMMLGGILIGVWGGFKNRSHTMALSCFFVGLGAVGLGVMAVFLLYLLCMGITGLFLNMFNAPSMATLQINVDAAYMGRVLSVLTMISSVTMPMGMVIWGPLGDVINIDWMMIGTGIGLFMIGFVFLFDKTLLEAGESKPQGNERASN
jgi:DHA3 family macrolide efflux protein-like MFS transporter